MKIGKYEFPNQKEFNSLLPLLKNQKLLNSDIFTILEPFILESAVFDENLNVQKKAIYSEKINVDILWFNDENKNFSKYRVEIENKFSHSFFGINFNKYKII